MPRCSFEINHSNAFCIVLHCSSEFNTNHVLFDQSVGITELHYGTKKRQRFLFTLKAFFARNSSDGSTFGRYPTFRALKSVGRKKLSVCVKNVASSSCCSETL